MADYKLIGHDYQTPDIVAKVTGRAKYAEDYRADGMLFCKLLLSPRPHARIRRIDASAALAMPGVHAVLTAEDMPPPPPPPAPPPPAPAPPAGATGAPGAAGAAAAPQPPPPPAIAAEVALTNEPRYEGEPILALAADSEEIAAEAIERVVVDFEPLPFVIDPIDSLRPGGPNGRTDGNIFVGNQVQTLKWTAADIAEVEAGRFPMNAEAGETQVFGDVEQGFKDADLILE
jgi:xanthine dehydrogenase molybdenum-binding subunit